MSQQTRQTSRDRFVEVVEGCEVCRAECNGNTAQCDLCGAWCCANCLEEQHGYRICRDCRE